VKPALRACWSACNVRDVRQPVVVGSSWLHLSGDRLPSGLRGTGSAVAAGMGTPAVGPVPSWSSVFCSAAFYLAISSVWTFAVLTA